MSNELMITESKLSEYLDLIGVDKGITKNERTQFIEIAKAYGLNPFKREIYIAAYGQGDKRSCNILVGYEVYIQRAEKSGKLDGYHVTVTGEVPNMTATITIHRKDWSKPFVHTVEYSEYVQLTQYGKPNKFWAEKPKTMLKKVAIGQGMRLCFPVDLGGMPYAAEEMPEPDVVIHHEEKKESVEMLTDKQLTKINTLISIKGADRDKMHKYFKVESFKDMTKKQAMDCIDMLEKKPDKKEEVADISTAVEVVEGEVVTEEVA